MRAGARPLVVGGTFRFVRNPMYLAVVTVLLGQSLLFASMTVLIYTLLVWAAMAAFVRWYEEPVLARRYGRQYQDYRAERQSVVAEADTVELIRRAVPPVG